MSNMVMVIVFKATSNDTSGIQICLPRSLTLRNFNQRMTVFVRNDLELCDSEQILC